MKLKSLVLPENLMINENLIVVQNYCLPREHVVVAEQATFLSTIQNQGESEEDSFGRLDFVKLLVIVSFQNLK